MESGALENGFIGCSGAWKKIGRQKKKIILR